MPRFARSKMAAEFEIFEAAHLVFMGAAEIFSDRNKP
jgi:hypothetical protein